MKVKTRKPVMLRNNNPYLEEEKREFPAGAILEILDIHHHSELSADGVVDIWFELAYHLYEEDEFQSTVDSKMFATYFATL